MVSVEWYPVEKQGQLIHDEWLDEMCIIFSSLKHTYLLLWLVGLPTFHQPDKPLMCILLWEMIITEKKQSTNTIICNRNHYESWCCIINVSMLVNAEELKEMTRSCGSCGEWTGQCILPLSATALGKSEYVQLKDIFNSRHIPFPQE